MTSTCENASRPARLSTEKRSASSIVAVVPPQKSSRAVSRAARTTPIGSISNMMLGCRPARLRCDRSPMLHGSNPSRAACIETSWYGPDAGGPRECGDADDAARRRRNLGEAEQALASHRVGAKVLAVHVSIRDRVLRDGVLF